MTDSAAVAIAAARGAAIASLGSAWQPDGFEPVPDSLRIPLIGSQAAAPIFPDLDLWDSWPLQHEDGRTVRHAGRQWWFFLSAPRRDDPGERHDIARIRLASLGEGGWIDHGEVLDRASSPGSREWAGSALLLDDQATVLLFFTAAGRRDAAPSFEQRLFVSEGRLGASGPGAFAAPNELVTADDQRYLSVRQEQGQPGMIKGFRDPAWFRDPKSGTACILFTASAAWDDHPFNGVIGIATRTAAGGWELGDPLVTAIGINNELERPHVLYRGGQYYLFWSTQQRTFAPAAPPGPNGLYAMTAAALKGPWRPVNGSGLVAANPAEEMTQSYSWWVTGEGEVWSFVDHWGLAGRTFSDDPGLLRSQFGGTPAPVFRLRFAGDQIRPTF